MLEDLQQPTLCTIIFIQKLCKLPTLMVARICFSPSMNTCRLSGVTFTSTLSETVELYLNKVFEDCETQCCISYLNSSSAVVQVTLL